ncbi:MAG: class D sortase [Candidatus Acidiferrales bacterium]
MTTGMKNRGRNSVNKASLFFCAEYLFLILGVLALLYAAKVYLEADSFQSVENLKFERARQSRQNFQGASPSPTESELEPGRNVAFAGSEKSAIGRLEIPSVGISSMVVEGDDSRALRLGIGHIPGTALPGTRGNVGLAGHRDTFFRPLRHIEPGDLIRLATLKVTYSYRVETASVVPATQTGVLSPGPQNMLTLVTCYPFDYIGPAPNRFIVQARETGQAAMEASAPARSPATGTSQPN